MILGIDEVGRGPWAGPLVVGAVVLGDQEIAGLTDSKKLTKKKRDLLDVEIRDKAAAIGLGWVHADELDEIGISQALVEATKRAVAEINAPYHEIIIDGTVNFLRDTGKGAYVTTLKKADLLISAVSAASIVAKVARDTYMEEQGLVYPDYGFDSHVGYGTAAHREAIEQLGVTPLHRLSFAPLQKYRGAQPIEAVKVVTSKVIGDLAEEAVADYLRSLGHDIVGRNWKTKYCEIDIISVRDDALYFTEVKYRRQPRQGGGLAAITPRKLRQMEFAAKFYAHSNRAGASNQYLSAISMTGEPPIVEQWLEQV